jgi:ATP-dependent RNA helicase MSS116, mitochondrial
MIINKYLVRRYAGVQLLVGGTNRNAEARRLDRGPNTLLVCTVGRFHDHADNTDGFLDLLRSVSVVVLDECDRLLEMGFRQEVRPSCLCPPLLSNLPMNVCSF